MLRIWYGNTCLWRRGEVVVGTGRSKEDEVEMSAVSRVMSLGYAHHDNTIIVLFTKNPAKCRTHHHRDLQENRCCSSSDSNTPKTTSLRAARALGGSEKSGPLFVVMVERDKLWLSLAGRESSTLPACLRGATIVVVVLESGEGKRESYQAAAGRYRDLQSSDSVVDSECWISQ